MNTIAPSDSSSCIHRPDTIAARQAAVEKVIRHMKNNLVGWDTDLSLRALAREGCYAKSHLIEVFEEVTGTTPHHFLASLRIQKAKELLLESGASVTEIALEVGYESFPTFSRTFSDYVGLSPSAFRRMPPIMSASELTVAATAFIAKSQVSVAGKIIEGRVLLSQNATGVIFVGTFTRGVPQGRPASGTVLLQPGRFCIARPPHTEFHLMAALVPLRKTGFAMAHSVLATLVSSHRICGFEQGTFELNLRPMHATDPPLVVSLVGLLT